MPSVAGLVLAGGRSSRFGSDKAMAVVDGTTLLERAVMTLRDVCDGPVLVASGDGVSRAGVADGQVVDLVARAGPLSGIAAGLQALRDLAPAVAVLATDHVAPSAQLLRLLVEARGDGSCATATVDEIDQPLHGVWATALASEVAVAVRSGRRSVVGFLAERDDVVRVSELDLRAAGVDPLATVDADRPEDLLGQP